MGAKGNPKTGGRKKGTPNKRTLDLVKQLDKLGINIPKNIHQCIAELDALSQHPSSKISHKVAVLEIKSKIYLELMQYLYPKRKAVDEDGDSIDKAVSMQFIANWKKSEPSS